MKLATRLVLPTILTLVFGATVASQSASAQIAAPLRYGGGATSEAAARVEKILDGLAALNDQMEELAATYRSATKPEQKAALRQELEALYEKGIAMQSELFVQAEKAYAAAPNADEKVTGILIQAIAERVQSDDYKEALRLADLMLKNKCQAPGLHDLAGVAAFATCQFDAAEKLFAQAKDAETLRMGERYADMVSQCKTDWAKEQKIRQVEARADNLPRVLMKTNKGDITIELFENEAPIAVGNFVSLVEKGYYNGLAFHRVLPGFMAQGGCPEGTGTGGPGYNIPCECHQPNYRKHFRGSLSMAHAGRDTGGSQFFLTFLPTSFLDGRHTVFGRVIDGFDVLAKIQRRDPQRPGQPEPDKMVEVKVIRKRDHKYKPTIVAPKPESD